jgi:hypothetical protein
MGLKTHETVETAFLAKGISVLGPYKGFRFRKTVVPILIPTGEISIGKTTHT